MEFEKDLITEEEVKAIAGSISFQITGA